MRPPSSRPPSGRFLLVVCLLSLFASPPSAFAKGNDQLTSSISGLIGDFQLQVRGIQGDVKVQLGTVPKVTSEAGFNSVIQSIGLIGYNAWYQHKMAYYDALDEFDNLVQTFGLDPLAGSQLRGVGLDADDFVEELLWNEPVIFSKALQMSLRRIRWSVERFDVPSDRFLRFPVIMSAQVFPSTRDKLLFTDPGGGSFTPRVRIAGIVGGTYGAPGDTEGTTTACVFGISAAFANVDLSAEGLGGPFNGSDTADSSGRWDVCLNLKHGYYKFEADDGTRTDTAEQGFLYVLPKLKF